MLDAVIVWLFLALQIVAWLKCRDYNFVLRAADKFTQKYIFWNMVFWFAAGVVIGRLLFRLVQSIGG